ncbi:protein of unknown function [Clostridium beijerinckii]|nr:protein of unknown function [Clostridium beijerinckii]
MSDPLYTLVRSILCYPISILPINIVYKNIISYIDNALTNKF